VKVVSTRVDSDVATGCNEYLASVEGRINGLEKTMNDITKLKAVDDRLKAVEKSVKTQISTMQANKGKQQ